MKKIVLIGGGHSHLETIYRLGESSSLYDYKLLLISSESHTSYSGMAPGLISGHYVFDDCHVDLKKLCERYDYKFIQQSVCKISPTDQEIHTDSNIYQYDIASINTGSISDSESAIGVKEWA
ncbi:hypothetical protein N8Z26_07920, partial [Burkholderiales bacterium]|nr:hypothetical protein [Burkholderiales bacterium]